MQRVFRPVHCILKIIVKLQINIFLLVIIDASDSCHVASFHIGALTTTTRKWDIRVTQYACGDYDMSGPPGCLQYYSGTSGNIAK